MKMIVNNRNIDVRDMDMGAVGESSLILMGDAETIQCTSYFDTPADSLIISPQVPIRPVGPKVYEQRTSGEGVKVKEVRMPPKIRQSNGPSP